jgi:hypothetical protein
MLNKISKTCLLVNREINTADFENLPKSWYAALRYFEGFKSVVSCDFYNTSSSAGDWEGYIQQKINGHYYIILFSQSNNCNWPHGGYTLYTGDISASSESAFDEDTINQIIADLEELYS